MILRRWMKIRMRPDALTARVQIQITMQLILMPVHPTCIFVGRRRFDLLDQRGHQIEVKPRDGKFILC